MSDGDQRSRWTPPALLARLDREIVPLLQWVARAVAWLLAWPFRTLTRAELRTRLGRGLHRNAGLLLFGVVTVAFLASAVHFQRYPDLRQGALASPTEPATLPADDPVLEPGPAGETGTAVGPVLGTRIDDHLERRSAALDEIGGEQYLAVVSFEEYVAPDAVLAALPEDAEIAEVQYRLPAEGERPQRLDTDRDGLVPAVEDAVDTVLEEFASEEQEVQRLLDSGTVEEEDFREDLELRLSELQTIRNLLATDAPVVFAVVVRAPGDDLRALSEHADVRLVDVAEADADMGSVLFYGVLPEDRDRATFGYEP